MKLTKIKRNISLKKLGFDMDVEVSEILAYLTENLGGLTSYSNKKDKDIIMLGSSNNSIKIKYILSKGMVWVNYSVYKHLEEVILKDNVITDEIISWFISKEYNLEVFSSHKSTFKLIIPSSWCVNNEL